MSVYEASELTELYEGMCLQATAECTAETAIVGGQPADENGLRMFCEHQLGLAGADLEAAVKRIQTQEIGEKSAGDNGEIREIESYGVNVLRHDPADGCCWLGDWQLKAALKQSASRIGLFVAKRGTKGDLAEMGRVRAAGISLGGDPRLIRLMSADGTPYLGGRFEKFMGRVRTPQGEKSIVHDSEIAPAGCRFSFELRTPRERFSEEQIATICACLQVVGVGSAKALERGKIRIDRLEIVGAKK